MDGDEFLLYLFTVCRLRRTRDHATPCVILACHRPTHSGLQHLSCFSFGFLYSPGTVLLSGEGMSVAPCCRFDVYCDGIVVFSYYFSLLIKKEKPHFPSASGEVAAVTLEHDMTATSFSIFPCVNTLASERPSALSSPAYLA